MSSLPQPEDSRHQALGAADISGQGLPSRPAVSPSELSNMPFAELEARIASALLAPHQDPSLIPMALVLCEDPDPYLKSFQEQITLVLAGAIGQLEIIDEYQGYEKADTVLDLAQSIVDALSANPGTRRPAALNALSVATANFLLRMDDLRGDIAVRTDDMPVGIAAWVQINSRSLALLGDIVLMPQYKISHAARESCVSVLEELLEWQNLELGPLKQEMPEMVRVWTRLLEICAVIGDYRLHDEVHSIARSLLAWQYSDNAVEGAIIIDQKDNEFQLRNSALEECFEQSIFALRKCQEGLKAMDFWHTLLKIHSIKDPVWHCALQGLAEADAQESGPYLGRVMNRIGASRASEGAIREMVRWLEQYLEVPGAGEVMLDSFGDETGTGLKPARHRQVLDVFRQRIAAHEREAARVERGLKGVSDPLMREILAARAVQDSQYILAPRALYYLKEALKP